MHDYASDPLIHDDPYKRPLLEAEMVALDRFGERLDHLTTPVLFCHGTDDPFVDYHTSQAAVERCRRRPHPIRSMGRWARCRHELGS